MTPEVDTPAQNERGHSIKIVAQRTGLSSHVIRVWERRYKAVTPRRTETNRRLYSDDDVARLRLLAEVTENGHTISNVADLSDDDLLTLLHEDRTRPLRPTPSGNSNPEDHLGEAIDAAKNLDAEQLERVLERASVDLTQLIVLEGVIVPLMHKIGELWHDGELRVVHEHTAYAVVSSFVSSLKTAYAPSADAPVVVVTTPAGQLHELGALIVAATAAGDGWRTAYLGASLPAEEIAKAVDHHNASAIALSIVYPPDDPTLPGEIERLKRMIPDHVGIIVGGRSAQAYARVIEAVGGKQTTDLTSLRDQLAEFRP